MGDENPIRTLEDYSKPSHEGYKNTIELPVGNNVVPLRSDTIRLVQNGCTFHELRSEDPNQHLMDFLKLVDSLDLDEDLSLYDNESWNDPRDFAKPVKAIALPQDVPSTSDRRLIELKNQVQRLMEAHLALTQPTQQPVIELEPPQPEEPEPTLEDEFQDLHLNLPVLEVLAHAPIYNAILDKYVESLELGKNDQHLSQGEMDHIFGLADGTKSFPVGIVKDVEVHIGKLKLLNDFYVIDMKKDPDTPLLVGRGFLAFANALIDCRMAKIAVGEGITRSVFGVKGVDLGAQTPYYARKDFLDCHLPREWEISRDVELNPFKDTLVFRRMVEFLGAIPINLKCNMWESEDLIKKPINWDKPLKNRDGAWHAKIRLINLDGEEFTKTLQSIPTVQERSSTWTTSTTLDGYDNVVESVDHCLVLCDEALSLWDRIFAWWGVGPVDAFSLKDIICHKGGVGMEKEAIVVWEVVLLVAAIYIWKSDEVYLAFGGNTRDLGSFGEKTDENTGPTPTLLKNFSSEAGDGVTNYT
ncbi:MAK10-like protein [Tanacetum coccineum]|uniref:MAK10-like protein n=1 Tax=Tanacetum coccineum TaxID=301880 RepID=A0ABQ5IC90_9ASTR